jgi:hypothetical protein
MEQQPAINPEEYHTVISLATVEVQLGVGRQKVRESALTSAAQYPAAGVRSPQRMASTHKKVLVRKFDRDTLQGYVAPYALVVNGKIEVLNTAGKVVSMDARDVKGVYFVRDFSDAGDLARKAFAARPRTEGLWVRAKFQDNDLLEGMIPSDLNAQNPDGYMLTPPDTRGNVQRIFIPRSAVSELTVLAVIGGPQGRRRKAAADAAQVPMFSE